MESFFLQHLRISNICYDTLLQPFQMWSVGFMDSNESYVINELKMTIDRS